MVMANVDVDDVNAILNLLVIFICVLHAFPMGTDPRKRVEGGGDCYRWRHDAF